MSLKRFYQTYEETQKSHPLSLDADMSPLEKAMNPPDRQDDVTEKLRHPDYGFVGAKRLDDGSYAAIVRLFTTVAICTGVSTWGYERRYCYKNLNLCLEAYEGLKGQADVPEGWIARRPEMPEDAERAYQKSLAEHRARNNLDSPDP